MMIDNLTWKSRNLLTNMLRNADQAEVNAIAQTSAATTISILDERISETIIDDAQGSDNLADPLLTQLERDSAIDQLLGNNLEEIERRSHWLGDSYPFRLKENELFYIPSQTGVYEYCLAVSYLDSLTETPYAELVRFFEVIAAEAFRLFLGKDADYIRTGAPAISYPKTSMSFKQGFEFIHQQTAEWRWSPDESTLIDLPSIKDEGVDFVVWKRADERKGALFFLGQCACGKTDWHEKTSDIDADLKRISRWFRKTSYVPPIRAFALPFPITASSIFDTLTDYAGLTMDRLRITRIAEDPANSIFFSQHSEKIRSLSQLVLGLPNAENTSGAPA
ncbi:MAG TPA: hypothetical protein VHB01_04255 [Nitrosospira sp.]|nr:hypothetical protein [Nitrosospira sp.]